MYFRKLSAPTLHRVTVDSFPGLDRRDRAASGTFARMENLCADGYPAAKVRPRRGHVTTLTAPVGLTAKEALIWVDGHTLYVGGHATGLVLREGDKESGITIHLVNEQVDGGAILEQHRCPVMPDDTPDTLAARIHQLEYRYFTPAVEKFVTSL